MTLGVHIEVNQTQASALNHFLLSFGETQFNKVLTRGVSNAARKARSDVIATGRKVMVMRLVSAVSKSVKKKTSRATGTLSIYGLPIESAKFKNYLYGPKPKVGSRAVRVQYYKDHPSKVRQGAFRLFRGGASQPIVRRATVGGGSTGKQVGRLPVVLQYGPSVYTTYGQGKGLKRLDDTTKTITDTLNTELARQMNLQYRGLL